MTQTKYFHVVAKNLARANEDLFSELAFRFGADGVSENLKFNQPDVVYNPTLISTPTLDLDVFFAKMPEPGFFEECRSRFSECQMSFNEEENQDWLAEWKKHFHEFCLVGDVWVVPSWKTAPANVRVISIDPGMAFGTGTHETTRLAAGFIWDLREVMPTKSILDVGTGSGILAILAEILGSKNCVGLDIDPEARRVARENLELNKTKFVKIDDSILEGWVKPFDVVIANIIDGVLVDLQKDLLRLVNPGGYLILSGIIRERDIDFLQRFLLPNDFKVQDQRSEGEWVSYLIRKS